MLGEEAVEHVGAVARVADQERIWQPDGTVPGLQFAATGGVAVRTGDA